ncbi:DEAD/DEAH box helicase [Romboutsia ilealis]|uniref:DEAD/DEAH box helicase n=1 Tax=Romboutsia faecis TaxID=2764597 RepID=A0ABR7JLK1_9FIRM|nr:DEAD/DEAH box helicase [Romboutsia faecis]MBC5995481.1 DEAD/DEAH box helicase [Romboutsia faecis]MRN23683.1 DEAD/DEAH box helicase [Romboutsia ilealis]
MIELRDYQIECVDKILNMKDGNKICYLPTGSGKTIIMSEIARRLTGRVLIVVDQQELRQQSIDKIKMICGENESVGSVQGKLDDVYKRIVVATRQSLIHPKSDRLHRILENGNFEIVMFDECHRAVHQIQTIINKINATIVVGFSATPWNVELRSIFDGFIYEKDTIEMIENGYLCDVNCLAVKSNTDLSTVSVVAGEFNQKQLSDTVDNASRNSLIVKAYKEYASDRKHTVIFATSIDHATNLANAFNLNNISARSLDSTISSDERERVLNDFKKGKYKVLVNCQILTTGFDFDALSCIIMAAPTKSKIKYVQQLGRGLRLYEDKKDCLVLDIADNYKNNLMSMKSIFDVNDSETILKAKERKEYEKREQERRLEEQRKIEEEEERIRLEQINLFNQDIHNLQDASNLDWYFGSVNKSDVAILSSNANTDFYIVKYNNLYYSYKYKKLDGYKYKLEIISESSSLLEILQEVEKLAIQYGSSFINKNNRKSWKQDKATVKQINACKSERIKTKWDAHKHFSRRNMWYALRDIF